ncbi:MAG TPA: carboxypeptidase regulatory-like domain-containing protein [Candidatus Eremiobacteraceae bacterium]|jgi:plastocyanin|nr:carboxypeptidase regulatory-like domain-containing protein [Candidatus Eremiobacteraceae bacterium]
MNPASNKSRILFCVIAGVCLAISAGSSVASSSGNESGSGGTSSHSRNATRTPRPDEVTGEVTLTQSGSDTAPDASQVVVWLTPPGLSMPQSAIDRPRYRLVQHNKRFEPSLLVVPVGSVVDFPNYDPWFHNVFSLYRGKRFDLGLYQAGAQRSVRFDRIGPSYLFCNIHPEMTGVVLAVDSSLYAISDKSGRYTINGVAPGKYTMHVWYENAKPESLTNLQRTVVVDDATRTLPTVSVPVVKQIQKEHKNKYGQDYDPDAMNPDY